MSKKTRNVVLFMIIVLLMMFCSCIGFSKYIFLNEDEYSVYTDGTLLINPDDFNSSIISFDDISEDRLKSLTLETKRGVSVGSSVEDFYNAYKDIACFVYYNEEGELLKSPPRSLVASPYEVSKNRRIKFVTHFLHEEIYDNIEIVSGEERMFESKGYYQEEANLNDFYSIKWMEVCIKDGFVENIVIGKE